MPALHSFDVSGDRTVRQPFTEAVFGMTVKATHPKNYDGGNTNEILG